MKANQRDFSRTAEKAAAQATTFFFCGPDEASASASAEKIRQLLRDPGERVELAGADLRKDPSLLGDTARSGSLFGDARHIYVRAHGDEAHDAVANHLEGEGEACPVLIVATGATDKSRTAKLLAKRDDALVAMFYLPDLASMRSDVRGLADAAGVQMDASIAERIARGANLDIRLARSEVEKLALYLDAAPDRPQVAGREALDAIGAHSEEDGFAPLVDAVLGGNTAALAGELRRMREIGLNPVAVLLALERRAAQLAALSARMGPRGDVNGFVEAEKKARRIFFKDAPALKVQIRCWRGKRLERLVDRLARLHQDLLTMSRDAELLMNQGLAEITRFAARGG